MHYLIAIAIACLLYVLQASYYRKHWKQNLTATISYSHKKATIGETVQLTEVIKNKKKLPIPVLYVKFTTSRSFQFENSDNSFISDLYHRNDIFSIMGNQQITRVLNFKPSQRGYFVTNHVDLIVNDLFLRNSYATKIDNHTSLYVYPKRLTNHYALSLTNSIIGEITKSDILEDPLSFRSIREYSSGDSMRYINWKSTAKSQQLMVNTYYDIQNVEVVILFNLDTNIIQRGEALQEYMLSIVTTILHHLNANGYAFKLAININDPWNEQIITTDLGVGAEHLDELLKTLTRIQLSDSLYPFEDFFTGSKSLFSSKPSNVSYLVISNYRKESLLQLYREKQQQGHSIHFICPEYHNMCTAIPDITYWEVNANEI